MARCNFLNFRLKKVLQHYPYFLIIVLGLYLLFEIYGTVLPHNLMQVRYGDDFFYYASVRPGITGIWQVGGRSNTTFEDRVCMDVQYVKKQSLALDCKILFKTIWVVFNGSGAS